MNDIEHLEKLLAFFKSEIYDHDLRSYLSNELIGLHVINKYKPEVKIKYGISDDGTHWTVYAIKIVDKEFPIISNRLLTNMMANDNMLSLTNEKLLISVCTRLLDKDDRKIISDELIKLTDYLMEKRKKEIQELQLKIEELKKQ